MQANFICEMVTILYTQIMINNEYDAFPVEKVKATSMEKESVRVLGKIWNYLRPENKDNYNLVLIHYTRYYDACRYVFINKIKMTVIK